MRALRLQRQLSIIAAHWPGYLEIERRHVQLERELIVEHVDSEFVHKLITTFYKIKAWADEIQPLKVRLEKLLRDHQKDPSTVSPKDWDKMVEGHAGKIKHIFGKKFPLDQWPEDVPYLNFVALFIAVSEESADQKAEKKQKNTDPEDPEDEKAEKKRKNTDPEDPEDEKANKKQKKDLE